MWHTKRLPSQSRYFGTRDTNFENRGAFWNWGIFFLFSHSRVTYLFINSPCTLVSVLTTPVMVIPPCFFDSVHACSTSYFSRLYLLLYVLFIFKMLSTVSISAAWDLLWPGVITFRKSVYIFAVVVRACVCVSSVWLFAVRVCRQGYLSSRLSPSQSWTYAARGWVRARGAERGEFVNADVAVTSQKSWTNGGRSAPFRECVEKTYTYTYIHRTSGLYPSK